MTRDSRKSPRRPAGRGSSGVVWNASATVRRRSSRLTIPTSIPLASTTGIRLSRLRAIASATAVIAAPSATVAGFGVITSRAVLLPSGWKADVRSAWERLPSSSTRTSSPPRSTRSRLVIIPTGRPFSTTGTARYTFPSTSSTTFRSGVSGATETTSRDITCATVSLSGRLRTPCAW